MDNISGKPKFWLWLNVIAGGVSGLNILLLVLSAELWGDLNDLLYSFTEISIKWAAFLVIFCSCILLLHTYQIIWIKLNSTRHGSRKTKLSNGISLVLILISGVFLFALLYASGKNLSVVRAKLEFFSPFIYLTLIAFIPFTLHAAVSQIQKKIRALIPKPKSRAFIIQSGLIILVFLLPYVIVAAFPLWMIPSHVITDDLPNKPLVLAHRGATRLAPENTIAAGAVAANYGVAGWEVDVTISSDGHYVMMHDDELFRTTNVAELFPDRVHDDISSFTLAELRQLDAGSWFVDRDPYNSIRRGKITAVQAESYRGEKIPTIDEVLNFTLDHGWVIDVDMKSPPTDHTFAGVFEEKLLDILIATGLNEKIIIDSDHPKAENMSRLITPAGKFIQELKANGIEVSSVLDVNAWQKNEDFRAYREEGFTTIGGLVYSKTRFSQMWCLGVSYVLTDIPDILFDMDSPSISIGRTQYMLIFCIAPSMGIIFGIRLHHDRKVKKTN